MPSDELSEGLKPPTSPCVEYLPLKLGHFWVNVGQDCIHGAYRLWDIHRFTVI